MTLIPTGPTTITLDSGLNISNFSSPHEFVFDTGEVLPACTNTWAEKTKLDINETEVLAPLSFRSGKPQIYDVYLTIKTTDVVLEELDKMHMNDEIDVILIPFMLLNALKDQDFFPELYHKVRVIRKVSRTSPEIFHNKFCV